MGDWMGRYSPWRHLRSLTHLELVWTDDEDLLDEAEARYFHTIRTIVMDKRLGQAERRTALAHELGHALRGDLPCGSDVLDVRQESVVEKWAARKLITMPALARALQWSDCLDEVADELWVTRELVETRLRHLHPAERAHLRRQVEGEPEENGGPSWY